MTTAFFIDCKETQLLFFHSKWNRRSPNPSPRPAPKLSEKSVKVSKSPKAVIRLTNLPAHDGQSKPAQPTSECVEYKQTGRPLSEPALSHNSHSSSAKSCVLIFGRWSRGTSRLAEVDFWCLARRRIRDFEVGAGFRTRHFCGQRLRKLADVFVIRLDRTVVVRA